MASPPSRSPIALLGLPWDGGSSYAFGAAQAPAIIREALHSPASNAWSESGIDTSIPGLLEDEGDAALALSNDSGWVRGEIEAAVRGVLESGRRLISLGGDHSVTYPVLRAMRERHARLTVIQFDSHPDLYDEFAGDRFSHACPFARAMEDGLCDRLVQVGIRAITGHGREQAARFGTELVEMHELAESTHIEVDGPVYLSIDLDVLDPAFAPGVAHREPGGMSVRQLLRFVHSFSAPIVAADVVEYNPRFDVGGVTATVAAKLVRELTGQMAA